MNVIFTRTDRWSCRWILKTTTQAQTLCQTKQNHGFVFYLRFDSQSCKNLRYGHEITVLHVRQYMQISQIARLELLVGLQ